MNGSTIAEVKATSAAQAETLWHYLSQIPATVEAQIFYALLAGAVFGMLANYTRLWLTDQITGSFLDYLIFQYPKRTLLAIFGAASWSVGEVSMGIYQGAAGEAFSWALILVSGFKNGLGSDVFANKGVETATAAAATDKASAVASAVMAADAKATAVAKENSQSP